MPPKRKKENRKDKSPIKTKKNKDGDQEAGIANGSDFDDEGKVSKSFRKEEGGASGSADAEGPDVVNPGSAEAKGPDYVNPSSADAKGPGDVDEGNILESFPNNEGGEINLRRSVRLGRRRRQHASLYDVIDKLQDRS